MYDVCMQLHARIAGRQQLHQPHTVSLWGDTEIGTHKALHTFLPKNYRSYKSINYSLHNNTVRTAQCVLGRYRRLLTEGNIWPRGDFPKHECETPEIS